MGTMYVKMAGRLFLIASLVLFGIPSASAGLVDLSLTNELEDGGTFSGRFSYDEVTPDREPSPLIDVFALERWTVHVTLGEGQDARKQRQMKEELGCLTLRSRPFAPLTRTACTARPPQLNRSAEGYT